MPFQKKIDNTVKEDRGMARISITYLKKGEFN